MSGRISYALIIITVLIFGSCSMKSQQDEELLGLFLQETEHLNFNDPAFSDFMPNYLDNSMTPEEKLEKLYYFARDSIVFGLEPSIHASDVLKKREGLCYLKAMLYASFCRRLGVPARLSQSDFVVEANPDFGHRHGVVKLYYDGRWIYLDTVSNPDAWYNWWEVPDTVAFRPPMFSLKENVAVDPLYITNLTYTDFETNDVPEKWLDYLKQALAEKEGEE